MKGGLGETIQYNERANLCIYLIMNNIPSNVVKTLKMSKHFSGSLRNILPKIAVHIGDADEIIFASAIGMCFNP